MYIRNLRKSFAGLATFLLILLHTSAFAQQSPAAGPKHSLWKVSSKTNTVYILGSVHLLKQGDYPLDQVFEKAYENSQQLYFEIDLDNVDNQKLQQLTVDKGTYGSMQSLSQAISKQTYELAKQRLAGLGLKIEQFERLKPWLLATTIAVAELQKLGYDPGEGVDQYFYRKAKTDGKKVDGFETAEYQLNLLADMPARMQEEMLLQTLKDLDETSTQIAAVVDAWKAGDAVALDNLLLKSFKDFPDVYKTLVVDRNMNWLSKIEPLIGRKENVMIIVGAAHLVGKDGLIAALKQNGYQVEQL